MDNVSLNNTKTLTMCAALSILMCCATTTRAVDVLWTAGGGIGYFTEASSNLAPSPSAYASVYTRLTERTWLGVHSDFAHYRPIRADESGSQWRVLAVAQWEWRHEWLPEHITPFAQFGIGFGRMEYRDAEPPNEPLHPWHPEQVMFGPTARIAGGLWWKLHTRMRVNAVLSFERLETAINAISRKYPTMLELSVGVSLSLPKGGSLTGFDETRARR